jgi:hypothetical protein
MTLPPALPGTAVRIIATSDLGAAVVPLRASYGETGTCAGIVSLLEHERERQPTIWLDVGDLVVGNPAYQLLGERPWAEVAGLPIAVTVAGNHEFDDGVDALHDAARSLTFPMLCANVDIGLPATARVETDAGVVGVIGLTHPGTAQFSRAPEPADGWPERIPTLARELRDGGARWVVALLHDGVDWWPADGALTGTRSDRLEAVARPWAADVDVIVLGHNFAAWVGQLAGTPAGQPHVFANSLVVVDLADRAVVRGVFRVPPLRPDRPSRAAEAIDAAADRIVGDLPDQWLTRTDAQHYLPTLIADAFRSATDADAGLVLPGFHGIQAPIDGAVASLGPGPVSELDITRLFAAPDYELVLAELRAGELRALTAAYWTVADPRNVAGDMVWWNWCRMPAGISRRNGDPATLAMISPVAERLHEQLGRRATLQPTGIHAAQALEAALTGRLATGAGRGWRKQ